MLATFKSGTACRGTQILVSDKPDGRFVTLSVAPVTSQDWGRLDGTLYIDEAGNPYMVFCHEWIQTHDGEICAMPLSGDLVRAVGKPAVLFRGSQPAWADKGKEDYVTDGPFLCRTGAGELLMIWSSFREGEYVEAVSHSVSGGITDPWEHFEKLLFKKDGGHGMIFNSLDGGKYFVYHYPNTAAKERPVLKKIKEKDGTLTLA